MRTNQERKKKPERTRTKLEEIDRNDRKKERTERKPNAEICTTIIRLEESTLKPIFKQSVDSNHRKKKEKNWA